MANEAVEITNTGTLAQAPIAPMLARAENAAKRDERITAEESERRRFAEDRLITATETHLLDGFFRAKAQNGEGGCFPADVKSIRELQRIAGEIVERSKAEAARRMAGDKT